MNGRFTSAAVAAWGYRYALLALLIIEVLFFSILLPDTFFARANFENIINSQSIFLLVTLGLTVPLLAGEFDLSVSAVLGFTGIVFGFMNVNQGWALIPAMLVALLAAAVIGLVNAVVVVLLDVNSLIATLGTGTAVTGLTTLISNNALILGISEGFNSAATKQIFGLQLPVYFAFFIALVLWFVYERSPMGRRLLFVGANREASRLAGLRVDAIRAGSLVVSALLAGVAGIILAGQLGIADPGASNSYLLPAFAGAFLGATTIKPGRFNSWGTVIALYLLIVGVTGLQLYGAGVWVQNVFNGASLVLGVVVTRVLGRRLERSK